MKTLGKMYWKELEGEARATRKCLETMKPELYDYKPHEKSMGMGYLALIVAEIPSWISTALTTGFVDFATWEHHNDIKSGEEFVKHFDKNMAEVKKLLESVEDEDLEKMFYLKNGEVELMKDTVLNTVSSSINHLVHHRGQLTVYMRMNDIPVPSIYGPSADDKSF